MPTRAELEEMRIRGQDAFQNAKALALAIADPAGRDRAMTTADGALNAELARITGLYRKLEL